MWCLDLLQNNPVDVGSREQEVVIDGTRSRDCSE